MSERLYVNDPTLHLCILLGFHEEEWDCSAGIPEPFASLLRENYPDLPLDSEVTLQGVMWGLWGASDPVDDPLRHRVFKLEPGRSRHLEVLALLHSVRLSWEQARASCIGTLEPQTEEYLNRVANLGGRFSVF